MDLRSRKIIDRYFVFVGVVSIALLTITLVILLAPIVYRGTGAFIFSGTVEHRRLMREQFERGDRQALDAELVAARQARQPVYDMLTTFRAELVGMEPSAQSAYTESFTALNRYVTDLLGPAPGDPQPILLRDQYGQTRWDRAKHKRDAILLRSTYDYSDPTQMGTKRIVPRVEQFRGTSLEPLFPYVEEHLEDMLRPRLTFYWQFLTDESLDAHMFGGIWPEVLGTIYLTLGAMIFAVPFGVFSAIYLIEYAGDNAVTTFLRVCVSTLAGVPSIVFALFGLAFFINTMHVSESKSVLAGSLTLSLLILPTVIRASEEAIRAVPRSYREASLALGAGQWKTIATVVLPAALPGILTGIVISMGRAAGETAPIIFTAAVSVGAPLGILDTFSEPTPALPWNIYNLATEHEAVDEIRHVQFGMVLTLIAIALLLNSVAIYYRARIAKKLKG